jgi:hypothetical protein
MTPEPTWNHSERNVRLHRLSCCRDQQVGVVPNRWFMPATAARTNRYTTGIGRSANHVPMTLITMGNSESAGDTEVRRRVRTANSVYM